MLNWFLGLAGIIMGVAIGQAVTNGTEGQRDTGRKFVLESFFSGSVPPAATSCYVSNGDMKYCMGADKEANDLAVPGELLARRSSNKNGLVAYGLGMRASNDETLWERSSPDATTAITTTEINTHKPLARSTWSMAGGGNKFFVSYNIEKDWFSDNEVVGKLMAAKIARSSANVIGVAFSAWDDTSGSGSVKTVYWQYGKKVTSGVGDLFNAPTSGTSGTGKGVDTNWKKIVPGVGIKDKPMITVLYEL